MIKFGSIFLYFFKYYLLIFGDELLLSLWTLKSQRIKNGKQILLKLKKKVKDLLKFQEYGFTETYSYHFKGESLSFLIRNLIKKI